MDFQAIIAGTVGKENTFGTCVGRVKAGADELSRASPPTISRARSAVTSAKANSPNDPLETFGGAGVVDIPRLQKLLRYICEQGFEHHVAANLSQLASAVHEAQPVISAGRCHTTVQPRLALSGTIVAGVDFGTLSVSRLVSGQRSRLQRQSARASRHGTQSIRCIAAGRPGLRDASRTPITCRRSVSAMRRLSPPRVRRRRLSKPSRSTPPDRASSPWTPTCSPSTILPLVRPPRRRKPHRSPRSPSAGVSKRSAGAAASIRHEWGFSKLLHWLRTIPEKRDAIRHRARALRHGGGNALRHYGSRSRCRAAPARWATNGCGIPTWGGLPPQAFLSSVDPLFDGVRESSPANTYLRSHRRPSLAEWAAHSACGRGSRSRSEPSTHTGTPSAPAAAKATSSTWSARLPASSR